MIGLCDRCRLALSSPLRPPGWSELGYLLLRLRTEPRHDVFEVDQRVDPLEHARRGQAEQRRVRISASWRPREEPNLSSGHWATK